MRRLAALVAAWGLAGSAALAQPQTRIYTQPTVPTREALDRLNLDLAWRTYLPISTVKDGIATVQHFDDQIFVQLRSGLVIAIDPETGRQQWRVTVGEAYPVVFPLGYNDDLVLVTSAIHIFALDRATGRQEFALDLPTAPATPPVADDARIYLIAGNGRLTSYAIPTYDPVKAAAKAKAKTKATATGIGTGKPTVAQTSGAPAAATPPAKSTSSTEGRGATGSTALNTRRTATESNALNTRRTASGGGVLNQIGRAAPIGDVPDVLWDLNPRFRIQQRPVLFNKFLVAAGVTNDVIVTAKDQRKLLFELSTDAPVSAPVAQYGDFAYIPTFDAVVYALNVPTGRIVWRFTANDPVVAEPLVTDEDVYVAAERGGLFRVNRETGEPVWRNPLADRVLAVNPKFVYAVNRTGILQVLDRASGRVLSSMDTSQYVFPITNDVTDRLLLAAHDGTLVSLRDKAYAEPLLLQNIEPPDLKPLPAGPITPLPDAAAPEAEKKPK